MKVIRTENLSAFSSISLMTERRFSEVKKPLPWIEPSINMIHLDAVRSFVFGSSLASIGCATYLLEHSLRMAVWDPIESGSSRTKPSRNILDEPLGKLLSLQKYSNNLKLVIPDATDLLWWQS